MSALQPDCSGFSPVSLSVISTAFSFIGVLYFVTRPAKQSADFARLLVLRLRALAVPHLNIKLLIGLLQLIGSIVTNILSVLCALQVHVLPLLHPP